MRILLQTIFYTIAFVITVTCQPTYSLEDCFTIAKKNNPAYQRSKNNVKISDAAKKSAAFNMLPSIYFSSGQIISSGKNIDPVTNTFVRENFSGGSTNMFVALNIFSGFKTLNIIKQSFFQLQASEYAYRKTELEMLSSITLAYAKAVYNREQVAIIKSSSSKTKDELNIIQEKINVGKLSKSEYYTVNARYTSEQADLIQAQNDSLAAINEMKYLMGLSYDLPFDIKNIDDAEINDLLNKNLIMDELLEKMLQNHPALLETGFAQKVAQMNLKIAKGNALPTISLTGGLSSNYNLSETNNNGDKIPVGKQLRNNFGKTVGVFVEIPLFSQFKKRVIIEKEKINLNNATLTTKEVENSIIKNTRQLINDFIAAKQKYLLQTNSLEQSTKSYNVYEEKYQLGLISSLELIMAKDQLYQVRIKTMQAKYDLYFKYKLIELLMMRL